MGGWNECSISDFRLPPRSTDNRIARNYLTAARRIDEDVTGFFFATGDIYEEAAHNEIWTMNRWNFRMTVCIKNTSAKNFGYKS